MTMVALNMLRLYVAALLGYQVTAYNYSYFFNHTAGNLGPYAANVSDACHSALIADIPACDGYFRWIAQSDYFGPLNNNTYQTMICSTACLTGYNNYRSNVVSSCAKDPQPIPGLPATYWIDATLSAYNQTCTKDPSSGNWCTDIAASINITNDQPGSLNSSQICSPCVISLFRHMQSTPYSNYGPSLASDWSSIQSRCKLSYPTAVPTKVTNATLPANFAVNGSSRTGCFTGKTYTVVSGDGCESIAVKHNVSFGALVVINDIFPDCTNLQLGQNLCLPPTCAGYVVQPGDTCLSIANSTGSSFQQLVGWNPTINAYCTNLIAGQNICISPPGGAQNYTTIQGASVTKTAVYASTTASPPNPIASGTTLKCGKFYQVQYGDYCQLVAVNQSIALGLFEAINPSIDANCSNLLRGDWYCVLPTADWNTTVSSTTVTPPGPTPSGTTPNCYQYYTVKSGDTCGLIENNYGITFAQLQYWNPSINNSCGNLLPGDAYCVNGAIQPPGTSPTAAVSSNSSGSKKRNVRGASMTAGPAEMGGVPLGWPHVNAPREVAARAAMSAMKKMEL